jgi:hypothetical protein
MADASRAIFDCKRSFAPAEVLVDQVRTPERVKTTGTRCLVADRPGWPRLAQSTTKPRANDPDSRRLNFCMEFLVPWLTFSGLHPGPAAHHLSTPDGCKSLSWRRTDGDPDSSTSIYVIGLRDDLHVRQPRLYYISSDCHWLDIQRLTSSQTTGYNWWTRQQRNCWVLRVTAILYGTAQTDQAMTDNVLDLYFDQGMFFWLCLLSGVS